ncbi:unnamed protein product, partial [Closterium sp. NIES-53]
LRDLLRALDCYDWFDTVAVSAEVEAEKPSSEIFHAACDMLGVLPHEAVHVGDSRNKDVAGAKRAGCEAVLLLSLLLLHSPSSLSPFSPFSLFSPNSPRSPSAYRQFRPSYLAAAASHDNEHNNADAVTSSLALSQSLSPEPIAGERPRHRHAPRRHTSRRKGTGSTMDHADSISNIQTNTSVHDGQDIVADNVADNTADIGASQSTVVVARRGSNRLERSPPPARKSRVGGSVNRTARTPPPARKSPPARKDLPTRGTVPAPPSGAGTRKSGDPAQAGHDSNTTRNSAPASAGSKRAAPPPRRPRRATSGAGRQSGNATRQPENAGRQSGNAGRRSSSGSSKRRTGRRGATPTRPVSRAAEPPIQFVRLTTANNATCLDGSPPAYYYRPGYGLGTNKWLIYLMGGRWCLSPSQCRLRADTDLGSTNGWPRPGDPGFESNLDSMGAGFQGMLSGDSSENPYFYSWNMVVVLYCDGGVFAGVKGKMLYDHSQPYYLSGRPILNSILGDLNNKGMKEADSVLLTGCSAGAIAVSMACDAMAQFHFPRTAKVKCLMDAGFFMDTPDITGQYSFRGIVQRMFRFHSMTAAADDDCRT